MKTYRDVFPDWADEFDRLIPRHMRGAVERYILCGIPPGGFLSAFVSGDLMGAVMRADNVNKSNLENYAHFFYWAAPSKCHKSAENFADWVDQGGALGRHETENAVMRADERAESDKAERREELGAYLEAKGERA